MTARTSTRMTTTMDRMAATTTKTTVAATPVKVVGKDLKKILKLSVTSP